MNGVHPPDQKSSRTAIDLVGAHSASDALVAALGDSRSERVPAVIAYANGEARSTARTVATIFRAVGRKAELIGPTSLRPASFMGRATRRGDWDEVAVADAGGTIGSVRLPGIMTRADALFFVTSVGDFGSHGPLALGMAARFVDPKRAVLARIAGDRSPRLADVALAMRPDWILLSGVVSRLALVATTSDPIVAELLGLALRRETADPDADVPGVWEDALVQRATELGLGVGLPSHISLRTRWTDPGASPVAFKTLVSRLRARIGLSLTGDVVDDNISF